jgi:sigma-B regulation protein RsbU (phosphoserine phosphatase)
VRLQDQALATLGGQAADIIIGTVFVFLGLSACGIAVMRRRSGVRVLVWLGVWSAMYGARPLATSLDALLLLPHWLRVTLPFLDTVLGYLLVVVGLLAFTELSLGKLRMLLRIGMVVGLSIALAGTGFFVSSGSRDKLMFYNNLLATCALAVLVTVVAVPSLSRKFLNLPDRGVLAVGTLVFAVEALYTNVSRPMGYQYQLPRILDSLCFGAFLLSFAYVALQMVFAGERRLLSIENELAIAREIQSSILPGSIPELDNLRISAAYRPMTAVAGDFYEFIPVDRHRIGFLVADVTGHGVPAALIAAMIKVAVQSVASCAEDPRELLRGLNRALSGQLRGQFVTAAYFWLDTQNRRALYSAAGHPPLLCWREGKLERIESNGLLFGVLPEPDYPVCEISLKLGDRFLLCTDGVTEPQNARGDFFGDRKLEEALRDNQSRPPSELSDQLLSQIGDWLPASSTQQDDITLIVIDVV